MMSTRLNNISHCQPLRSKRLETLVVTCIFWLMANMAIAESYADAQGYFDQKKYSSAIIELKNVLQTDGDDIQARLLLGKIYLKLGDMPSAAKELERAQSLGAESKDVLVPLSKVFLGLGKLGEIAEKQGKVEQLDDGPYLSEYLAVLGHSHLADNNILEARVAFEKALQLSSDSYAQVGLAKIAFLEQRLDDSSNTLHDIIEREPENLDAMLILTQVLASKQECDEVVKVTSAWSGRYDGGCRIFQSGSPAF